MYVAGSDIELHHIVLPGIESVNSFLHKIAFNVPADI